VQTGAEAREKKTIRKGENSKPLKKTATSTGGDNKKEKSTNYPVSMGRCVFHEKAKTDTRLKRDPYTGGHHKSPNEITLPSVIDSAPLGKETQKKTWPNRWGDDGARNTVLLENKQVLEPSSGVRSEENGGGG